MKLFKPPKNAPKVLLYDIETAPLMSFVWSLRDENLSLDMLAKDWHLLSWSAKWLDAPAKEVMYQDQRNAKNIEDDKELLKGIWKLLDEADVVITQNGKKFDQKKLNARFIINGFQPPSSSKHIDTLEIARKHFGFTSNKLAYMSTVLNKEYKKQEHSKFAGFKLWSECLKGNLKAWKEMEKYNKYDVLSLEELYRKLIVWHGGIDFNIISPSKHYTCKCGSKQFMRNGHTYTPTGRYQRFKCKSCGAEYRGMTNEVTKKEKQGLLRPVSR